MRKHSVNSTTDKRSEFRVLKHWRFPHKSNASVSGYGSLPVRERDLSTCRKTRPAAIRQAQPPLTAAKCILYWLGTPVCACSCLIRHEANVRLGRGFILGTSDCNKDISGIQEMSQCPLSDYRTRLNNLLVNIVWKEVRDISLWWEDRWFSARLTRRQAGWESCECYHQY